ncbi:MAG: oxidoreductase [Rhodobacteraceae bacterium]|nr:oxidoreductase [Paracoccaceae bacterium]
MHRLARVLLALLLLAGPLAAEGLPAALAAPLLTVTGQIAHRNTGDAAVFDLAMLEAMPAQSFTTRTTWTDGAQHFTGVALRDLMTAVRTSGSRLRATAINGYSVEIPAAGWREPVPIIAYRRNGLAMSLREHGPLWIVYPYDAAAEYRSAQAYSHSIWQLDRIAVLD